MLMAEEEKRGGGRGGRGDTPMGALSSCGNPPPSLGDLGEKEGNKTR